MVTNVLVVDDSAIARSTINKSLYTYGIPGLNIYEANNGYDALALLKTSKIDLVFSDLNMPDFNGEELLILIKSNPQFADIPVIISSSLINHSREERLMAEKATAVLQKPVNIEDLKRVFSTNLNFKQPKKIDIKKDQIILAMEHAVRKSFQNMLYVDFDKAREIITPGFSGTDQVTFVEMDQPFDGSLYLVIGYELASEILKKEIENSPIPRDLIIDETMAEICNTVAGQFMAQLVPSDKKFDFGIPICTKIAKEKTMHIPSKNNFALEFKHNDKPFYCLFKH